MAGLPPNFNLHSWPKASWYVRDIHRPLSGSIPSDPIPSLRPSFQVRYYDKPELRGYIRISVGKPEHSDKLIAALAQINTAKPAVAAAES